MKRRLLWLFYDKTFLLQDNVPHCKKNWCETVYTEQLKRYRCFQMGVQTPLVIGLMLIVLSSVRNLNLINNLADVDHYQIVQVEKFI